MRRVVGSRREMEVPTREQMVSGGMLLICLASFKGKATRSSLQIGISSQERENL